SSIMPSCMTKEHNTTDHKYKKMLTRYQRNHDQIAVGAYTPGNDPQIDEAIERYPWLEAYLQQGIETRIDYPSAAGELATLLGRNQSAPEAPYQGMNHG